MEGWCPGSPGYRLEGLKHNLPLHAPHLTRTVGELSVLAFERPLSTTNKMTNEMFFILFQLPVQARACSLPETHLLH